MIKALFKAFPYTIPVMSGYLFLGIAFGVLCVSSGYTVLHACLMSIFIYAGSMQFVALDLFKAVFQPVSVVLMTLLVNARHLFYGVSMLKRYENTGKLKPYLIFSLTDETYSLVSTLKAPEGVNESRFLFAVSLLNHLYWIVGSAAGACFESFVPFNTEGIDFAMTALFLVVLVEQWENTDDHRPALIGLFSTFISRILFGTEWFILVSMAFILILLGLMQRKGESHEQH